MALHYIEHYGFVDDGHSLAHYGVPGMRWRRHLYTGSSSEDYDYRTNSDGHRYPRQEDDDSNGNRWNRIGIRVPGTSVGEYRRAQEYSRRQNLNVQQRRPDAGHYGHSHNHRGDASRDSRLGRIDAGGGTGDPWHNMSNNVRNRGIGTSRGDINRSWYYRERYNTTNNVGVADSSYAREHADQIGAANSRARRRRNESIGRTTGDADRAKYYAAQGRRAAQGTAAQEMIRRAARRNSEEETTARRRRRRNNQNRRSYIYD